MFEFEPEEQTVAEAMTAGQEMSSSESAAPPRGQGAHARAVATAIRARYGDRRPDKLLRQCHLLSTEDLRW